MSEQFEELLLDKIKELDKKFEEPYWSAGLMAVDDIIEPGQTRVVIINTLERLAKKQQTIRPWKKHALIPI